jgi:hypothetical protein
LRALANKFRRNVLKMRQALTFLATFKNHHRSHENAGRHLDSGAAHHLGRSLHRSVADFGSTQASAGELTQAVGAGVGDKRGRTMLSVDQILRLISVPAVFLAFHIAAQVSGG